MHLYIYVQVIIRKRIASLSTSGRNKAEKKLEDYCLCLSAQCIHEVGLFAQVQA